MSMCLPSSAGIFGHARVMHSASQLVRVSLGLLSIPLNIIGSVMKLEGILENHNIVVQEEQPQPEAVQGVCMPVL